MPTSSAGPERAERQRLQTQAQDEFLRESDWAGMLLGIGFAVGGVLGVVTLIHLYLRWF